MRVVVGLGNPGTAYVRTRHNVGFEVVEELARRWGVCLSRTSSALHTAVAVRAGERVVLAEPQLYMNRSGDALSMLGADQGCSEMIVVHDDLDLELGTVRVKHGGGTAGHRGLDSIVERYGSDFARVRVGIGRPPAGGDTAAFVLSPCDAASRAVMDGAVCRAADAVECVLREGIETAMNQFNVRRTNGAVHERLPVGRN